MSAPSHARSPGRVDGAATRAAILRAARDRLIEVGYANLNVRDIAREAGVNHALIGYHFHGKQPLVLAVLDEANRQLLERQERMYQGTPSASQQWQQACDFYDEDLQSGFVRLLMELMGASFHDQELRREFVPRVSQWHRLVESAVKEFIAKSGLELPVSAEAISAWIVWFWTGMEASMMLGIGEKEGHQREALAAMATLLRRVERRAKTPAKRRVR
ncbi:MAG: TetR/AcrR family transcriptional regulator [Pseudomonadota bacterium]|nr:TetR/AcrR family transcriptional regulator [Pseudomonadota bacterium]